MKHSSIFLFIAVALSLYTALNYYWLRRCADAFRGSGISATIIFGILVCLAVSFPLGRILEAYFRNSLTRFFVFAGSLYLGLFFYALLSAILIDFIRLGGFILRLLPFGFPECSTRFIHGLWFTLAGCIIAALCAGYWIASHPRLKTVEMTVPKRAPGMDRIAIAAVSDIHFGRVLGRKHLEKIKFLINRAKPDVILLLGDLFDEVVSERERSRMTAFLKGLSCDYGVYAISGNHDYFSGISKFVETLKEAGVFLLQDTAVTVNGALTLIGRKDRGCLRFGDERKSINEIAGNADRGLPLILMDHQPFHLEEAQACDIDVQLSGHTHHGQLFPLNLLYRRIYETSWGYLRKGNTQVVVSCGAGTWGPPLRTNSIPEVLKIIITFAPRSTPPLQATPPEKTR